MWLALKDSVSYNQTVLHLYFFGINDTCNLINFVDTQDKSHIVTVYLIDHLLLAGDWDH